MKTYHLEPIPTLPTLRVMLGNETVGFLYPPKPAAGQATWDVCPKIGRYDGLPDGDLGFLARRFATEAQALAWLGLSEEAVAA